MHFYSELNPTHAFEILFKVLDLEKGLGLYPQQRTLLRKAG